MVRLVKNLRETTDAGLYFAVTDHLSALILEAMGAPFWLTPARWTVHERSQFLYEKTFEPYVYLGTDDSKFHSRWLERALDVMERLDGVVAVNDLHSGEGTTALISRRYIEEESCVLDAPNAIAHLGYRHNYAERETFEVAKSRGRFAYCPESIVEHLKDRLDDDETYRWSNSFAEQDAELYESRSKLWR